MLNKLDCHSNSDLYKNLFKTKYTSVYYKGNIPSIFSNT